jgi:hypothetical protein
VAYSSQDCYCVISSSLGRGGHTHVEHFALRGLLGSGLAAGRWAYHWIDQLDAVVLGRVVAGGNHDANGLGAELARAQGGEQADTKDDGVEEVSAAVRGPWGGRTYAFMRNWSRQP